MAVKIGLALGLFIVICMLPAPTASQVVPDGLVYTEVKKTLVRGVQGVLTCRFYGVPLAVYWRKGLDPDDLSPMVVWYDGEVSGPRFDDGSCDVDDNYSLIINNVSTADAGRIYCTVSNYNGILIDNYTDISITDTAITTTQRVTLQMRQATHSILRCTVHIRARRVSWKKGTASSANESLVVLENNKDGVQRSGAGYDEGSYNITEDYSLVIKEVQVHHEGLYICEVTDFDTGISFRNQSFVNVVAQPLKPFPTIQECLNTDQYNSNYCTLVSEPGMTLTCEAMKYYPTMHLTFLHGSRIVEPLDTREWNNTDGTKTKTLTIAARGSKELYTCVASNTPGTSDNKSTSVLLHDEDKFKSGFLVIILISFAALISSVACVIWKKKHIHYSSVPRSAPHMELEAVDVKDITEKEMQVLEERVDVELMKHYRRIYVAIETKSFEAEKIIHENRSALFDTHRMLTDWQQRPASTYRQYSSVVNKDASIVSNKSDPALDHTWPYNEELKSISRHLTPESMTKICQKLKIDCKYNNNDDEEKRFDSLREWRNKVAEKSVKKKHEQLSSALESNNLKGLLPPLKGQFIYKAELVDMALQMFMQDLLPIAEALGIHFTRLITYRPSFDQSHFEIGTTDLLSKFLIKFKADMSKGLEKGTTRPLFCTELGKFHYRNVAALGMCVYEMSYGELFSIAEAMTQNTREKNTVEDIQEVVSQFDEAAAASKIGPREEESSLGTPSTLPQGEDIEEPDIEKAENVPVQLEEPKNEESKMELPAELNNLRRVLQLSDEDIANGLDLEASDPVTAYTLLRLWKEKPHQTVFNYRAELARELRRNTMSGIADKVIAGNYIKEQNNFEFIQSTIQRLNQDQLEDLGQILKLSTGKKDWHKTTPLNVISKQIFDWVAHWTKEMKGSSKAVFFIKSTPKDHRDLNDRLVEHGFLSLARDIMIIEQQLAWL